MSIAESLEIENIIKDWKRIKETQPRLRMREIASQLKTSEGGLLAASQISEAEGFPQVSSLRTDWGELFAKFGELGHVMVLTRNESCVHERKGIFEKVSSGPGHILVVGADIDLRLFPGIWKYGFTVEEPKQDSIQRSFQFFNENGEAMFKLFLTDRSNVSVWERLRSEFKNESPDFSPLFSFENKKQTAISDKKELKPETAAEFLSDWGKLEDTHEFFSLLKKHDISRIQSMEIADGKFTKTVETKAVLRMLEMASLDRTPIMVFVGNPGSIQIHTGEVSNIKVLESWWNVLDLDFNLHLRSDLISKVYIVDKPSKDGVIHSMEVYDADGELIVQFFGKRKPGQPERTDWMELLDKVSKPA
ncbi:hemin-degrading HenS.ChuX domain protein [Leptospira inadai serovar Lyme str. 10]|uniref:Hemin-degrading HenS.ChuX domain protein n=2 Tax=Leptospira inadai serovar Lyme TaxID=293084 RepID=V6HD14_9LEPT|nr:hemin-degrading factor [Leptospira inadai]EQA36863.1 hemin-degrading HenS.ChuX domain protein [Leptospira inadai serovar Lyme str. 10]PNV74522.1 hemin-degrading factor [Leptospira inadai serovar Lyme]